jgi:hypothetical protein
LKKLDTLKADVKKELMEENNVEDKNKNIIVLKKLDTLKADVKKELMEENKIVLKKTNDISNKLPDIIHKEDDNKLIKEEENTSFLEKEKFYFSEKIENSRIISNPNQYSLNLLQIRLDYDPIKNLNTEKLTLTEQTKNRLLRFFLAFLIVLVSSFTLFLVIKYSIDWVKIYLIFFIFN